MASVTHKEEKVDTLSLDTSNSEDANAKFKRKLMRKVELPRLCAFRMCHECN